MTRMAGIGEDFPHAMGRSRVGRARLGQEGPQDRDDLLQPGRSVNHITDVRSHDRGDDTRGPSEPDGTVVTVPSRLRRDGPTDGEGRYTPDGTLLQKRVSTYDEKGEPEWAIYRGDGTPAGQRRVYDERVTCGEHQLQKRRQVSRETFAYEFDARGNWVKSGW